MKCPYCKQEIDADSCFCDQCGKPLMFCPECRQPKRGTECPACGETLISAAKFHSAGRRPAPAAAPAKPTIAPVPNPVPPVAKAAPAAEPAAQSAPAAAPVPMFLSGGGLHIELKAGPFGRTSGIFPEFSFCNYVSGRHGEFRCAGGNWEIVDYGSTNGTFVNGVKLIPNVPAAIKRGDVVKIATLTFTVQ